MNFFEHLLPADHAAPQEELRVLPEQPDGGAAGYVYVGSDYGWMTYSGGRPRAGGLVRIVRQGAAPHALVADEPRPMREPIHAGECLCKCPGSDGLAFYLTAVDLTTQVIALDTAGLVRQVFGQAELGYGVSLVANQWASVAVDPDAPHDLWVLDDRRGFLARLTDANPFVRRGYFTLCRYAVTGGRYTFQSEVTLADPYQPVGRANPNPGTEPDPPAIPTNCLGVVAGSPCISMLHAPARYQTLANNRLVTETLTQAGAPYPMGLRGNIVTVPDRPAAKTNRYVIASDGTNFNLLQFSAANAVTKIISLTLARPVQLATVCNRLTVLSTTENGFT